MLDTSERASRWCVCVCVFGRRQSDVVGLGAGRVAGPARPVVVAAAEAVRERGGRRGVAAVVDGRARRVVAVGARRRGRARARPRRRRRRRGAGAVAVEEEDDDADVVDAALALEPLAVPGASASGRPSGASPTRDSAKGRGRADAAATMRYAAPVGSPAETAQRSRTSWSVRSSQTPSDATMATSSSARSSCVRTSGVAMQPTRSAVRSPRDRENAHPGRKASRSQMRGGSPSSSSSRPRSQAQTLSSGTWP